MSAKNNAIRLILEETLISKTTIRNFLGCTPKNAQNIFDEVKAKEIELYKFESREFAVPTDLFLEMRGLNYELIEKRYSKRKRGK